MIITSFWISLKRSRTFPGSLSLWSCSINISIFSISSLFTSKIELSEDFKSAIWLSSHVRISLFFLRLSAFWAWICSKLHIESLCLSNGNLRLPSSIRRSVSTLNKVNTFCSLSFLVSYDKLSNSSLSLMLIDSEIILSSSLRNISLARGVLPSFCHTV